MANYYANIDQLASSAEMQAVYGMITTAPAQILGYAIADLTVGAPADFVLLDALSPEAAIRGSASVIGVIRGGCLRIWSPRARVIRDL